MSRLTNDLEQGSLWDDAAFRSNVKRLAKERGRSVRDVLISAGVTRNFLFTDATASGRSTEALMRIARELDVSLDAVMGQSQHTRSRPTRISELAARLFVALGFRDELPPGVDADHLVACLLDEIEKTRSDRG